MYVCMHVCMYVTICMKYNLQLICYTTTVHNGHKKISAGNLTI